MTCLDARLPLVVRNSKEPQVGYDARMALGHYRGMGAYLRELIRGLEDQFVGFSADGEEDATLRISSGGHSFHPAWEQLSLPRRIASSGVTTFIAPYNTAPLWLPRDVRLLLVVHDLIFMQWRHDLPYSPSSYQNLGRLYRRWVVPHAIRRANLILTVSEATKHDLIDRFDLDESKVAVIPNTINATWFDATTPTSPSQRPVLLCISGEAPSKNLRNVLQAISLLERSGATPRGLRITIAGVSPSLHNFFARLAQDCKISSHIRWLPFVSEAELQRRMRRANVVLVPSLYEGFGRPLLEALACGSQVVASDITALVEVGGNAVGYFDPRNPEDMMQAIAESLASSGASTREARLRQAQRFHPLVIRQQIENFWRELRG